MIDTILFDLDGTIIDTNELILTTFLHVLEGHTLEPFTREHLIPDMGKPLVEQLLLYTGRAEVDDLVRAYREFNLRMHDELVREFPHVSAVLKRLHGAGIRLGVVTNKIRMTAEKGLQRFGLSPYMDVVISADDVRNGKPDPEGILQAVERLGARTDRTLMVGDSQYDLEAASNAGVRSAGVAWSLKGEPFLTQYNPDYMLKDMRELLDIVGLERDEE